MKSYTFTLTEAQANTVLHALAQQPYAAVVETINEMQKQAAAQVDRQAPPDSTMKVVQQSP